MEVKWMFYKSSTVYDFDTSRAILVKIISSADGYYLEDAEDYLKELELRFGDGYCWMDEIEVEYK